ncbi:MAG: IMP dehydrogenase [Desulfobacula sp.]|jgi:IMP dehydrogenase|uniref:IMP dehydrogenase n=1 Tax=Desulfobacula sp. TaxID=2593537 RepID=UPI001D553865|nr:IMP dehydrogenase [Desulfobacula sp.]MBT3484697.1 IMP dehydrogenase [Desulfobacula sp.]MBT3805817.1 IMP dehydrogenase [Desulfobacula sp.]MBT4026211.1 IMP dehydrogenase [Desulfobacula sp.]MBT4200028.1 IMP dehydrogenase [Desulfobacula sp.]
MSNIISEEGLSFDDVLLLPGYSAILPDQVKTHTRLTKKLELNIPIVSAAMDTVTEALTAISMARAGGLGFIHRNLSIEDQAVEVDRVKKSESGMIVDPITVNPDVPISEILKIMARYRISGIPVTEGDKLVGIVTNRDLRFETQLEKSAREVMTSENLVTVPEKCTLEESKIMLHRHRIEKLLVVDKEGKLKGLITIKDIEKIKKYPNACKDSLGRLRAGAAIGVGSDMMQRVELLLKTGADALVIDTSHGHSKNVIDAVKKIKNAFPDSQLIAGNVAMEAGAKALIDAGVDAVKIGIGPGSICTTRIVAGVGVPQLTAIQNCNEISKASGVPIIADGGIKFSGDITKALGAGADSVMLGTLLAGTHESPGEIVLYQGRSYKAYRGMGSVEAMRQGSSDRYYQKDTGEDDELVPEGIVGRIPFRGTVKENIIQMIGGLKAGMGYLGADTIQELHEKARFIKISAAGLKESHVHDVSITKEAPNYRVESS